MMDKIETFRASLRDVIPCNLRRRLDFVSSCIDGEFRLDSIVEFFKCYGYMMYDRDAKVRLLRERVAREDVLAHTLINALDSCRTTEDFSQSMKLQMQIVRDILQSAFDNINNINDDGERPAKKMRLDGDGDENASPDYDTLLRISIDHLKSIVSFIDRDSTYFDHCLSVNEEMQHLISRDHVIRQSICTSMWIASSTYDSSAIMTIVAQDMLLSTGTQTHVMFLFVIRVTTIVIFLIVNFVRNSLVSVRAGNVVIVDDDGDVEMRHDVTIEGFYDDGGTNATNNFPPVVSIDNFVATFVINTIRECFATYLDWPVKLLANDEITIAFSTMKRNIMHELMTSRGSNFSWMRVMRGKLYVNDSALLGFFEEFSTVLQQTDGAGGSGGGANGATNDDSAFDNALKVLSPVNNVERERPTKLTQQMRNRYEEFSANIRLCKSAICATTKITTSSSSKWKSVSDDCALLVLFATIACLDDRLASSPSDGDCGGGGAAASINCRLTSTIQNDKELLSTVKESLNAKDKSYFAIMQAVNFRLMSSSRISRTVRSNSFSTI